MALEVFRLSSGEFMLCEVVKYGCFDVSPKYHSCLKILCVFSLTRKILQIFKNFYRKYMEITVSL